MNTNAIDAVRHHETWHHALVAGSKPNFDTEQDHD
jgi:hypothetical protein